MLNLWLCILLLLLAFSYFNYLKLPQNHFEAALFINKSLAKICQAFINYFIKYITQNDTIICIIANLKTTCVFDHSFFLRTWSCIGVLTLFKISIFKNLLNDIFNRPKPQSIISIKATGIYNRGLPVLSIAILMNIPNAREPASPIISLLGVALNQRYASTQAIRINVM